MSATSSLQVPLPNDAPPGIYVHIPFCRYVCPYCDFNVYARQEGLIPAYIDALVREMELRAATYDGPAESSTLFIGGGTPSLLPADEVARIIDAAVDYLRLADGAEITLEANPEGISVEYARDVRAAGVNRLSIGVQTLAQSGLKVLGRLHGAQGAENAYKAARQAGFQNISLDFIYGWPGQTIEQWQSDLVAILRWDPEHVSLYSLIVETGTPIATAVNRGQLIPVDDDEVAGFYDLAVQQLDDAGWEHYEIANWSRGSGLRSIHNQIYWQNGRYFGIGAGAHGFLGNTRASNVRLPAKYVQAVTAGTLPVTSCEDIDNDLSMGETMMLGLRLLRDGVSARDFERRHGLKLAERFSAPIARFTELGLLTWSGDRLLLTDRGALVSNSICAEFLP